MSGFSVDFSWQWQLLCRLNSKIHVLPGPPKRNKQCCCNFDYNTAYYTPYIIHCNVQLYVKNDPEVRNLISKWAQIVFLKVLAYIDRKYDRNIFLQI